MSGVLFMLLARVAVESAAAQVEPHEDLTIPEPPPPAYEAEPAPDGEQAPQDETEPPADKDAAGSDAPPEPLPGPKYAALRWKDDFSYLDGPPGSYTADPFDPVKNIRFDDWRLSIGGSTRGRLESRTNKTVNQIDPTQDTAFLHRYFLHADLKYRRLFRVYVEGVNAMIENNDSPLGSSDENRFDFHQYFADVRVLGEEVPLAFRAGRQELSYGEQRVIGATNWSNTRRKFDGFKLMWECPNWRADGLYVFPVPDADRNPARRLDHYDSRQVLAGTYVTYKGLPGHEIDVYYLYYRNSNEPTNSNSTAGSLNLSTLGARLAGKQGPWDYDAELIGQFGRFAGDAVQAWAAGVDAGYTLAAEMKPRLGAGFDFGSGDRDPFDGKHGTFNTLFSTAHGHLGLIDLVGRQNILSGNVNLTVEPVRDVQVRGAYYAFWLAERADALYNAGRTRVRRDPTGGSPRDVGHELDLTVIWKINVHASLLLGYSHFWNGGFVNATGLGDDGDFIYFQYELKF